MYSQREISSLRACHALRGSWRKCPTCCRWVDTRNFKRHAKACRRADAQGRLGPFSPCTSTKESH